MFLRVIYCKIKDQLTRKNNQKPVIFLKLQKKLKKKCSQVLLKCQSI